MACCVRLPPVIAVTVFAADMFFAMSSVGVAPVPASARFFDDRFPFQSRRHLNWSARHSERSAPDYSKAPSPKTSNLKDEIAAPTPIMVLGDAMADWLAYGLELAYADSPDIGILRRHRTSSGLIRTEVRSDPRGEYPDWPQAARELIASQKPKFVLMMIGINDRRQIREAVQVAPAARTAKPPAPRADDPAALELDRPPEKPN